jgi:phosphohistidine swiveling domain-containing protein
MADWNPAEMIGLKPAPLAYDLYAHLITEGTWSAARRDQGYAEVACPLMVKVLGTPFINIGASVASFVPAHLALDTRRRIVAACVEQLRLRPQWHDKIEFELIPTCYKPGGVKNEWLLAVLSGAEHERYNESLLDVTNDIIRQGGSFDRDFARIGALQSLLDTIRSRPLEARPCFRDLLAHAKEWAAPLFARVARAAFMATDLLRHATEQTGRDASALLVPVRTVVDDLIDDYRAGDFAAFLRRHGHIRPGTYDIRTPSYEEAPDQYFDNIRLFPRHSVQQQAPPDRPWTGLLTAAFQDAGYDFSVDEFTSFARRAIWAREQVKYLYAGILSEALSQLVYHPGTYGVGRDLLAFAKLEEVERLLAPDSVGMLREILESRKEAWAADSTLRVPSLIFSSADLFAFEDLQSAPNFITQSRIAAPAVAIGGGAEADYQGSIVVAEQADPGFDWIFTHGVAGLVTAYGGLNSHMAVRCREMQLPAVIGIGSSLFEKVRRARTLLIDCASQRLEIYQ